MRRFIYKIYGEARKNPLIDSIVHYLYGKIVPMITGKYRPIKYDPEKIIFDRKDHIIAKEYQDIQFAVIADDMTYDNLKKSFKVSFLTPDNWLDVLQNTRPDVFFCESAWSGINEYKDAWRGKIYKNQTLLFENRKVLLDILDYCDRAGIKTIFWNKEDPIYFDDKYHNFSETAILFDYVFTTAEECVRKYREKGHAEVYQMGFGFSPDIFNSKENAEKENKAVFAGSWYGDHPERCRDMERAFDLILEKGIPLEIFDRQWGSANPLHQFPDKYKPYLRKAVPYEKLAEIYQEARFAVNINTEKESATMYARRVHELMACRCIVISNASKAMLMRFGKNVWFLDEPFDLTDEKTIRDTNYAYVMERFTNKVLFEEMLDKSGMSVKG